MKIEWTYKDKILRADNLPANMGKANLGWVKFMISRKTARIASIGSDIFTQPTQEALEAAQP